jgi:hypothetical protein
MAKDSHLPGNFARLNWDYLPMGIKIQHLNKLAAGDLTTRVPSGDAALRGWAL